MVSSGQRQEAMAGTQNMNGKGLSLDLGGGVDGVPPYKNSFSSTFVLWGVYICVSLHSKAV